VKSNTKAKLVPQIHDDDLRVFLIQKKPGCHRHSTLLTDMLKMAIRLLSKNRQMNVVKLCHNYWHTGSLCQTFYGGDLMYLSENQRRLDTHTQLPVPGCGLPSSCLVAESQKGHANVASPGSFLDNNGIIHSLSDLEIPGNFSSMTSTACFHRSGENKASNGTVIISDFTSTCISAKPSSYPSAHAL
jgi:hypothetical protein